MVGIKHAKHQCISISTVMLASYWHGLLLLEQGCYHGPGSVGQLGVLSEAMNDHFDEVVIVLVACAKQNLADDVGGRVMKHNPRTQC